MKPLRKGARALTVDAVPFAWMPGRMMVEIRNRLTNKAYHVPRHRLEENIPDWDDCDGADVVLPSAIETFIRNNREEHELL